MKYSSFDRTSPPASIHSLFFRLPSVHPFFLPSRSSVPPLPHSFRVHTREVLVQVSDAHASLEGNLLACFQVAHDAKAALAFQAIKHGVTDVVNVGISVNPSSEIVKAGKLADLACLRRRSWLASADRKWRHVRRQNRRHVETEHGAVPRKATRRNATQQHGTTGCGRTLAIRGCAVGPVPLGRGKKRT